MGSKSAETLDLSIPQLVDGYAVIGVLGVYVGSKTESQLFRNFSK